MRTGCRSGAFQFAVRIRHVVPPHVARRHGCVAVVHDPAPRIRTNSRNRKRCPCTGAGEPVGEVRRRRNRLRCRSWRVPRQCLRPWPACRSLGACAWQRTPQALPSSTPARSDSWTSSRKSGFRRHGVVSGSVVPARLRDLRDACLKPPKRAAQAVMSFSMPRRTGIGPIAIANRRPANKKLSLACPMGGT